MDEEKYLNILRSELIVALGCTEPVSIAYAAAKCKSVLNKTPDRVEAECSGNIIKNVNSVVVPNTGGLKGIEAAVIAGTVSGRADAGLEVLSDLNDDDRQKISSMLRSIPVSVNLMESDEALHFKITMFSGDSSASVEIMNEHTNIVRIELNGETIFSSGEGCSSENSEDPSFLTVEGILEFSEKVQPDKLEKIIGPQIEYNTNICREGMKNSWGAEVGRTIGSGVSALTAAGSDARMSGCPLPVVINSGSGNQGITCSVPVIEKAHSMKVSREKLLRALAISNLLAVHQKYRIGRLSAYCGVITAACGAGAAITWLEGGTKENIEDTMTNTLATISGIVCDGAKPSCAGKIAVAVDAALLAHSMSMLGRSYKGGDGIVKSDIEDTVKSVGKIATEGMKETDKVILSVMME